jgi:hypothetical protein
MPSAKKIFIKIISRINPCVAFGDKAFISLPADKSEKFVNISG